LLEARVLVLNGLDFEPWLPRLLEASGFKGQQVLASEGVAVRRLGQATGHDQSGDHAHDHKQAHTHDEGHGHSHGDVDPHAWQDLSNGLRYVRNIAQGLIRADPRNARYYEGRAANYSA